MLLLCYTSGQRLAMIMCKIGRISGEVVES